ncbi:MFS transporter [Streptomyces sp. NPDC059740]|uniref:MFS transporter n=1 Tax=Streptomyces sp. NPDC059740 TaxID=3346926 RepID=UPI00365ADF0A
MKRAGATGPLWVRARALSAPSRASRPRGGLPGQGRLRFVAVADNVSWHLAAPLLTTIAAAMHTTVDTVTYAVSAYTMGYGLALPFWARVVERRGLRVVSIGLLLATASGVAAATTTGPASWVASRAVSGIGFAVVNPVIAAYYEAVDDAWLRQRGFAALMAVTSVSAMLTPLWVGALAAAGYWRSALLVGLALTVGAACVGLGLPVLSRGSPPSGASRWFVRWRLRRHAARARRSTGRHARWPVATEPVRRARHAGGPRPGLRTAGTRRGRGAHTGRRPPGAAGAPGNRRPFSHAGSPTRWTALLRPAGRRSAHSRPASAERCAGRLSLQRVVRLPGFWGVFCLGWAEGAVMLGLPSLFAPALSARGLDRAVSPVTASYGLSVLLGAVLVQHQARLRSARFLLLTGGHLGIAAALVASLRLHAPTFLVAAVLLGFAWSMLHTTLQTWAPQLVPENARATTVSFFATSALVSSATVVFVAAPIIQVGRQSVVFWGVAAMCLLLTLGAVALCGRPVPYPTSTASAGEAEAVQEAASTEPTVPAAPGGHPLGADGETSAERAPARVVTPRSPTAAPHQEHRSGTDATTVRGRP